MAKRAKAIQAELPVEEPAAFERTAPGQRLVSFGDVLGQGPAVAALAAAVRTGRVHHAWIFHGPAGVGKFTTALAFGAVLLDPTARVGADGVPEADRESAVRRMIGAGTHPDLHVISKELALYSDDRKIREAKQLTIAKEVIVEKLIKPAAMSAVYRTGSRATKVFIVDEAELMDRSPTNAPTQNAILKMLEEPPAGTVFILVTANEDRVLPTIRSRCQRVAFGPLGDSELEAWYVRAGMPADEAERRWLLKYSGGSPGWIASAVEHGLHGWHRVLSPMLGDLAAGRCPPELGSTLGKLVDEQAAAWVKRYPGASKEAANHAWAGRLLGFLAEHFRAETRELARAGGDPEAGARAIELIGIAERQVAANVSAAFVMENLAGQLAER